MSRPGSPKRIGEVLGKVFTRRGACQITARAELEQLWRQLAGSRIHERTRLGALRRGELEILVDNSPLLQELEGFAKREYLAEFQRSAKHSKIRTLRFRRM